MTNHTAYFARCPYRLSDLRRLFHPCAEKPCAVEKTVVLAKADYENFINDLTVDRWFIEKNTALCRIDEDGVWHCILVRRRGQTDGVLIMPEGTDFPKWAAYISDIHHFFQKRAKYLF